MSMLLLLLIVMLCTYVLVFEFTNGFHDTANAVATVIYTRSLRPQLAVMRSGMWNMFGVLLGGVGVAMSIANLLPIEVLTHDTFTVKVWFFLTLLVSSIIWNLFTRYKWLPCSSMHALIWSVIGVSLAYSTGGHITVDMIPWHKLQEVFWSLLASPLIGFSATMIILSIVVRLIKPTSRLLQAPWKEPPPIWTRALLITTCTAISFAHGSNDGQKWVGIMMAILVVFLPWAFHLNIIPFWVVATVAVVLGLGTMIGWKRIVVTIGEKIGKHKMTYAQWATAEIVAAATIWLSTFIGLPVSTTHVLSSGIAWSMAATGGMKDLQMDTVKNIAIAWILTLPCTLVLGYVLFELALFYVGK